MGYETSGNHYKNVRECFKKDCVEKEWTNFIVLNSSIKGNDGYMLCESKIHKTKTGEKLSFIMHIHFFKEKGLFWYNAIEDEFMPAAFTCPASLLNKANSDRGSAEDWRVYNYKAIEDQKKEKENIKNMVKGKTYHTYSGQEIIFESHETKSKFLGVSSETGRLTYCKYEYIKWE